MRLQFVGCGDALGSGGRYNTCFHLTGDKVNCLIDCGASSLPALKKLGIARDGINRFLGGSPLTVAFRLILLSILVGVVLAAIGFDPWNIVHSIRLLFQRIWDLGFDAINGLWRYFLLGAVIVIPVWLLSRMFGAPRSR